MSVNEKMKAIADAIRDKTGKTEEMTLDQMATEIAGIETGGGSEELIEVLASQSLTEYSNEKITNVKAPLFYWQYGLQKVSLPNCTTLSSMTFYGCDKLVEVNIPKLMCCENNVFRNCSSLTEIVFPNHSGRVDQSAFEGCTKLQKADFAEINRDQGISGYGFGNCKALTSLIIRSQTVVAKLAVTSGLTGTPIANGTGYIYVPSALLEEYKTATNWSVYAEQFRTIEGSEYE